MNHDDEKLDELLLVERVLAACMRDPSTMERFVRAGCGDNEVEVAQHKAIVRAMVHTFGQYQRADSALVEEHLRRAERWPAADARKWVSDIAGAQGSRFDDETLSIYLDRMRHNAAIRRVRRAADRMRAMADSDRPASEIAAEVTRELEAIVVGAAERKTRTARELSETFISRITQPSAQRPIDRVRTGIDAIDKATRGGVRRGLPFLIGAATGIGKTTFAQHMSLSSAQGGARVLYFSLETPADMFWDGIVEMAAKRRIEFDISADAATMLVGAAAALADLGFFVEDGQGMTAEEIAAKIHYFVRTEAVTAVYVDNVHNVSRSTRHQNDSANWMHIADTLKRAADRYMVALFELGHMKDPSERMRGKSKATVMQGEDDFGQSLRFGGNAGAAMILDREKHHDDPHLRNLTRVRLTKNRPDKDLVTTWMRYDPRTTELYQTDARGDRETVTVEAPAEDEWEQVMRDAGIV